MGIKDGDPYDKKYINFVVIFTITIAVFIGVIYIEKERRTRDFLIAIKNGNVSVINSLLIKYPKLVNAKPKNDYTPLIHAIRCDKSGKIIRLLLANDADVNMKGYTGWAPLHMAIICKRNNEILNLLIAYHGDINIDNSGVTPLHLAAAYGNTESADFLISNGADINADQCAGCTSLHYAVDHNRYKLVEFLLSRGAKINAQNRDGKTPLGLAKEKGHTDIADLLRKHGAKE